MASSIYPNYGKILLALLGTSLISALVWVVGPHIQLGGTKPLASFLSRYLIAGGLLALWATVTLYKLMSGRRLPAESAVDVRAERRQRPASPASSDNSAPQGAMRMSGTVAMASFGYYGKPPVQLISDNELAHYNLPASFITAWHDWLATLMVEGATAYRDKWPALYQQSPAYRFALSAGIAGDSGWAGILLPTAAVKGNHFPFCLAAALPDDVSAAEAPYRLNAWYESLEQLVQKISRRGYDSRQLQKDAQQFATSRACTISIPSPRAATFDIGASGSEGSVSFRINTSQALDPGIDQLPLLAALLTQTFYQYSVWTTSPGGSTGGSDSVIASGLPTGTQALALFSRDWAGSGCGNLLLTGLPDTQRQLRKPRLGSSIQSDKLAAPKQAPAPMQDDDITMLKGTDSGAVQGLGSTKQKSD